MAPPARGRQGLALVAAAAIVLVVGVSAAVIVMRQARRVAPVAAPVAKAAPAPARPSKIFIGSFDLPAADSAASERTRRIAAGVASLLRASGAVPLADAPAADAMQLTVRPGDAASAQLIPQLSGRADGPPIDSTNTGAAMSDIVRWVARTLNVPADRMLSPVPAANEQFATAFAATDSKAAINSVRAAIAADPNFLAAQRLSVDLYDKAGDRKAAVESATRVAALDPADVDVRRRLGSWRAAAGDPVQAVRLFGEVIARQPNDRASLEQLARYALSAGDEKAFEKLVARIEKAPGDGSPRIHRPDIFALAGSYDRAAPLYYDIEAHQKSNAALALKIGRIAALRDSYEIAGLELDKLRKLSPDYGAPLLEAYIAGRRELLPEAEKALQRAQSGAGWDDDVYTYSAEIYGMLSKRIKVIDSLEKGVARGEANATFILLRPPYFYLGYDQRSSKLKKHFETQKFELRDELAKLAL